MTTALISSNDFLRHQTGAHPERPERYSAILNALVAQSDVWEDLQKFTPRAATDEDLLRCHAAQNLTAVQNSCAAAQSQLARLDADTVVSRDSDSVARLAAGGACQAVDLVLSGQTENAFVACRPPGHHATIANAMGFCLYNNIAVAARYAQTNYPAIKNVLIVDFDVHHGNGTQDIFYADNSVYYFSLHQYPWYPGTGAATERGSHEGDGYTLNIPLSPDTDAPQYLQHFEQGIEKIARDFTPDLMLISAGFDAHVADPLGHLSLTDEEFAAMTLRLREWAKNSCQGRVVSCLEGGYNLRTLGTTVRTHVNALVQ